MPDEDLAYWPVGSLPGAQYVLYGCVRAGAPHLVIGSGLALEEAHALKEELNARCAAQYPGLTFARPSFGIELMLPRYRKGGRCMAGDFVAVSCKSAPQPLLGGASWWREWLGVGEVVEEGEPGAMRQRDDTLFQITESWWVFDAGELERDKAREALSMRHALCPPPPPATPSLWGCFDGPKGIAQVLLSARRLTSTVRPTTEQIEAILEGA